MPTENSSTAIQWRTEGEYIAVAETRHEIAILGDEQLKYCLGSKSMSICYLSFPTDTSRHTCLATLYFGEPVDALQACDTRTVQLPQREEAVNLGNGQWLITSASSQFTMKEISLNETHPVELRRHPGCTVCLISLPCGSYIEGPHVRLRPDMISCSKKTPFRLNSTLTSELHSLFNLLPGIEQLPQYSDLSHARAELLTKVQGQLINLPEWKPMSVSELEDIAKPIVHNLTTMVETDTGLGDKITWTQITCMTVATAIVMVCLICLCPCITQRTRVIWERRTMEDPRSPGPPSLVDSIQELEVAIFQSPVKRARNKSSKLQVSDRRLPRPGRKCTPILLQQGREYSRE